MVDHSIKEVIVNVQWVIQIPRSRFESSITSAQLSSERDNMRSHDRTKIDQLQEGHS